MTKRSGEAALDIWSLVHFASGASLGAIGVGPFSGFALLLIYEAVEAALRRRGPGRGVFEFESWSNIAADMCFGTAGLLLAWAARAAVGHGAWLP